MIISIDTEKAFDKNQIPFHNKITQQFMNKRALAQYNKWIY